jgi:hypothetical protein
MSDLWSLAERALLVSSPDAAAVMDTYALVKTLLTRQSLAQPLALIVIYTVIFSQIMKPALPGHDSKFAYSIYLCAGILIWQLFSDLVGRSVGVFVRNADLLKKVNLPKLALPVVVVLSALSNFAVIVVLFAGFLLLIGAFPASAIFAIIPVLVLLVAFALGLGSARTWATVRTPSCRGTTTTSGSNSRKTGTLATQSTMTSNATRTK